MDWKNFVVRDVDHLIGDRALIAFVKADIKARVASTVAFSHALKQFFRANGIGAEPIRSELVTYGAHMRHIFLAYAYLRGKPFEKVEPNTKAPKISHFYLKVDSTIIPNPHGYYGTSISPDPVAVSVILKLYRQQFDQKEVQRVAS